MKLSTLLLVGSMAISHAAGSYAQKATVSLNAQNQTVETVLDKIENQTEFSLYFNNRHVDLNRKVSVSAKESDIFKVLDNIFAGTNVRYSVVDKKIILSAENIVSQQTKKTVTGIIQDEKGEPIVGANVVEKGTMNGTVTNMDGEYSLSVSKDAILQVSYLSLIHI